MSLKKQKNTSVKKVTRNVLAQPYEFIWPILKSDDEINELSDILKELLPKKKCKKKLSWTQLRKLSKEERKEVNKLSADELDVNVNKIILGVNAVTRAVEKKDICCILVEANVDPMLMIKHIILMGQNKNIPVVLLSGLKKICLEKIGFASLTIGLKKSEAELNSHFYKLYEKISHLSQSLPAPKSPKELFPSDKFESEPVPSPESEPETPKIQSKPFNPSSVYKYRSSTSERVFQPPEFRAEEEFISLAHIAEDKNDHAPKKRYMDLPKNNSSDKKDKLMDQEEAEPEKIKLTVYQPLKVKQIQKNPKRLKATKVPKPKKKIPIKKKN
ncbi:ribonuclease P protein subunit p38-like [Cotesia glomerata]|uniref:Ribosomal protein eL8/eL30/eS12/Gadd45 domain-containing protein n=1 Tax=Cotesia glomerata TaxID=32391 RepID=A0AAV7J0D4_COTGL|nr:ribonuclease P protein subunit p38-like [Cotesia glomerata]KAH0564118.1 hypothetical protein KQX54_009498 [Cotesia glomerata]